MTEVTELPRIVKCPKCRLLLPEYSHYTVYRCGGCGATLQAKKRKKVAANPESCTHEADANSRNVVNLVSEYENRSSVEQPTLPQKNVLRTRTTNSSSEDCFLEGDGGSSQIESGECNNKQLILLQENAECTRRTSSFSGDCSSGGNSESNQNENGECKEHQSVLPQEEIVMTNRTNSSSGHCSLNINGARDQREDGECDEKQMALTQQNVVESTTSSIEEHPLDVNENGDLNGKQLVLPREKVQTTKSTSSSSGEYSLDVNDSKDQIISEESDGEKLVLPQEEIVMTNRTNSSSGHCSLNINGARDQREGRERDEKQLALTQQNVVESTSSSIEEHPLDVNENGDLNEKQLVLPQEKVQMTKSTSSSSGEYSLDVNDSKDQIISEEGDGEKLVLTNGSKSTSFSSGSLDENPRKEQDSNGKCNREQLDLPHENMRITESTGFPLGKCSLDESGGRDQNENGENIQITGSTSIPSEECSLDEIGGRDQNENGEFNVVFSLSDEEMEKEVDVNKLSHSRFKQHKVSNNGCPTELTETKIEASSVLMGGQSSAEETTDTHLQLAGAARSDNRELIFKEAKEQLIGASDGVEANNDQSAQIEVKAEVGVTRSDDTAKSLTDDNSALVEGSTSGSPVPSDKQMKQGLEPKPYTFDHSEVMNKSSELSGDLEELSKSPTTRSCHAYDGSVSSYDEMDKQFLDQHLNSFKNNDNAANVVSKGRHRKGKGPINSMNIPPDLPRGKLHVVKDTKRTQYEPQETTRHDHTARHQMRSGTGNYPPRVPYHRSGSQSSYGSDIPSKVPDDEHYFSSSSFLSRAYCEDSDQEKMNLLRMIYKLQNELKRTSSLKGDTTERLFPDVSYKGSHDFHEGRRFSHDLSDPWSDARYYHGPINWRQRSKISTIPFSAEASSSTHHVDNSCFHCQRQEWRYSAELPPHALCQHEELCKYHPVHNNCCFPHRSYPFRAPRYISSKHQLYGHETTSYDQRHRAHEMRMYYREKQIMNKKHFRPVARGAPFVTCRNCFKLLQLPADFLLFQRACHQLKCGHCSEILKFSLQDRSHIVSYDPSQHVDQSEVINRSTQLPSSASRANFFHSSHVVPVSFSDDYGNDACKSYSSGGDPVPLTSFHALHGSEHDTNDSCGAFEEEDRIAPRHARTGNAPVGIHESKGTSSNMSGSERSSEIETVPPPRSSPLHQLMGYSSPSQVIRGIQSFGKGKELMKNEHDHS